MRYNIMLADDEPIMRKALLTLTNWQDIGCEVVYTAANGQEVMDNLERIMPDILITDIKMPGKSGMDISKYIWEKKLPVKVILLTGYADFSYAQSAVKYGVTDYITKTGVFDELIVAVESAKASIAKERLRGQGSNQEVIAENTFKAIFDNSLYTEQEITEELEKLPITLNQYRVMLLQFHISEEREKTGVKKIYQSLTNFLGMEFGTQMVRAIPVERDMFAIVLNMSGELVDSRLENQCVQMLDMLDNFMKLYAYIGIGNVHTEPVELKAAYDEAEQALEYGFVEREKKIHFYGQCQYNGEAYPIDMDKTVEELCGSIRKGSVQEVTELFQTLITLQKEKHCSAHLIQNTGILIQNKCRTILADYDKNIYEVTGMKPSISQAIYQCRNLEDFQGMLSVIMIKTAEAIHIAVNRKQSLIYACQKYIDMHYEENIMVTDIAKEVGASASYLSRIFKETTGQTIIFTLNQKKIEKAKEYLHHTDMKIYEIAQELGFENITYFSHFFKKYVGVSPKDYKGE